MAFVMLGAAVCLTSLLGTIGQMMSSHWSDFYQGTFVAKACIAMSRQYF